MTWLCLSALVVVFSGLLGAFWGAPLMATELESGSFGLVWAPDGSRVRWLASRLTFMGLAAMAGAGLAAWLVTRWAGPLDRAGLNQFGSFDARDIAPAGHAAFAFALGVLLGTLLRRTRLRRTRPAMAAPLAAFAGRLAFRLFGRLGLFGDTAVAGHAAGRLAPGLAWLPPPVDRHHPRTDQVEAVEERGHLLAAAQGQP
jgi:hypothetical protein